MALITIVGFPAAGKSTRAAQLAAYFREKGVFTVDIVSDHELGLLPAVYDDSASEKPARGALFTALQRRLATNSILILDSLNYIKGFRYQIYCAARELKLRTCTVHVVAPPDICRERNSIREPPNAYTDKTQVFRFSSFLRPIPTLSVQSDNLIMRYEEPSSMVRWDAPLFTILWTDDDVPGSEVWDAVTTGNIKPPNAGTLAVAKAPSDALHVLEQTTTRLVSAVIAASNSQTGGGIVRVPVGSGTRAIELPPRTITLSEMQRVKRQFVAVHKKLTTLGTTEKGAVEWDEESVGNKFLDYITEHVHM